LPLLSDRDIDPRGIVYGVIFGIGCWLLLAAMIWGAAHLLREVL
jgi:hypothetical protein